MSKLYRMFFHVVYTPTQIATALCDLELSVLISCSLRTDAHCERQIEKASNDLQHADAAALFLYLPHC